MVANKTRIFDDDAFADLFAFVRLGYRLLRMEISFDIAFADKSAD